MISGNIANGDISRKGLDRHNRLWGDEAGGYTGHMQLRLKEIRLAKRLTQRQVAEMAGLSVSYYTELELGRKQINALRLDQLAKVFGVTPQSLIAADTSKIAGLAEAIAQLPPESQDLVRALVAQLSGSQRSR